MTDAISCPWLRIFSFTYIRVRLRVRSTVRMLRFTYIKVRLGSLTVRESG